MKILLLKILLAIGCYWLISSHVAADVADSEADTTTEYGLYNGLPTPAAWLEGQDATNSGKGFTLASWDLAFLADRGETPDNIPFKTQKINLRLAVEALQRHGVDILAAHNLDRSNARSQFANQMVMLTNDAYFLKTVYWHDPTAETAPEFLFSRFGINLYTSTAPRNSVIPIGNHHFRIVQTQTVLSESALDGLQQQSLPLIIISTVKQPLLSAANQWNIAATSTSQAIYYSASQLTVEQQQTDRNPNFAQPLHVVRFMPVK